NAALVAKTKSPTAGEGSDGAVHSETGGTGTPACHRYCWLRRRIMRPQAPRARREREAGSGTTGVPNCPVALAEKSERRPVVPLMVSLLSMSSRENERLPPGMGVPMAWPCALFRALAMRPPV